MPFLIHHELYSAVACAAHFSKDSTNDLAIFDESSKTCKRVSPDGASYNSMMDYVYVKDSLSHILAVQYNIEFEGKNFNKMSANLTSLQLKRLRL